MGGIYYTNASITQKCALCQEKNFACTVIQTAKGKFKLCGPCASWKTKCGVVETHTSLCLYSTSFTFHPTALLLSIRSAALLLSIRSELPFSWLRPVSVYTRPCRVRLDYSVYIVSMLPLHILSVPSASDRSLQYRKHLVRDISLGPST